MTMPLSTLINSMELARILSYLIGRSVAFADMELDEAITAGITAIIKTADEKVDCDWPEVRRRLIDIHDNDPDMVDGYLDANLGTNWR